MHVWVCLQPECLPEQDGQDKETPDIEVGTQPHLEVNRAAALIKATMRAAALVFCRYNTHTHTHTHTQIMIYTSLTCDSVVHTTFAIH